MRVAGEEYVRQVARWPQQGRVILAQYDADSVVVYQAYKQSIGQFASSHGYFGGDFKLGRMSWIKTNFLWLMYRSEWGTAKDQEVILAVWLRRTAFEEILSEAVHSSFMADMYPSETAWRKMLKDSNVRVQWDPDHDPRGGRVQRRAIQLGLRGRALARYAKEWILGIEDISGFVRKQREHVLTGHLEKLTTPREEVYPVKDRAVAERLGITAIVPREMRDR